MNAARPRGGEQGISSAHGQAQIRIWPVPPRQAVPGSNSVSLGNDVPYISVLGHTALPWNVCLLLLGRSVDFLSLSCSFLLRIEECNSWILGIPSSTLLIKILPRILIKMPYLRSLSLLYISMDILFILQCEYLYSALHSQNGEKKKRLSRETYQKSVLK